MRYEELYDLKVDPAESTKLTAIPQYRKQLDRVRDEWATRRKAVR